MCLNGYVMTTLLVGYFGSDGKKKPVHIESNEGFCNLELVYRPKLPNNISQQKIHQNCPNNRMHLEVHMNH